MDRFLVMMSSPQDGGKRAGCGSLAGFCHCHYLHP